jgi:hypothetical protein
MDADAVQGIAGWIMAELVRIFDGINTQDAQQIGDSLVERKTSPIWDLGK